MAATPTAPGGRKPITRRTPSAEVKQVLVDAAVTVLERDGVDGLTVRAVAAEAGVAPMGVYNHLQGKDGLVVAVLTRAFAGLRDAVTAPESGPIADQLRHAGRGYRRFALDHPVLYGMMFSTPIGTPNTVPTIADGTVLPGAEDFASVADASFDALTALVVRAQSADAIIAGDPVAIAQQIWSAVHGAVSLELRGLSFVADPGALYEDLVASLIRGFTPPATPRSEPTRAEDVT